MGVKVNLPAYTNKREQLESFDIARSRRVSNTRIHVERAIGRIKEYRIASEVTATNILPHFNEMFFACYMLTNFQDVL